jgi:hypothetical protein
LCTGATLPLVGSQRQGEHLPGETGVVTAALEPQPIGVLLVVKRPPHDHRGLSVDVDEFADWYGVGLRSSGRFGHEVPGLEPGQESAGLVFSARRERPEFAGAIVVTQVHTFVEVGIFKRAARREWNPADQVL